MKKGSKLWKWLGLCYENLLEKAIACKGQCWLRALCSACRDAPRQPPWKFGVFCLKLHSDHERETQGKSQEVLQELPELCERGCASGKHYRRFQLPEFPREWARWARQHGVILEMKGQGVNALRGCQHIVPAASSSSSQSLMVFEVFPKTQLLGAAN